MQAPETPKLEKKNIPQAAARGSDEVAVLRKENLSASCVCVACQEVRCFCDFLGLFLAFDFEVFEVLTDLGLAKRLVKLECWVKFVKYNRKAALFHWPNS